MEIIEQGTYEARLTDSDILCYYEHYQIHTNNEEYNIKSQIVDLNCFRTRQDVNMIVDKEWNPKLLTINVLNDASCAEFKYFENEIDYAVTDRDGIVTKIKIPITSQYCFILLSGAMLIPLLPFRKKELLNLTNDTQVQIIPYGIGSIRKPEINSNMLKFSMDFQLFNNSRFKDKFEVTCNPNGRVLNYTTATKNLAIKLIDKNE